jgi:L-fuculose-phosphate aldolase
MEYETIVANDIVVLDLEMNVIDGNRVISVEKQVHLAIYRARNDVHAIMHTHPTYSSALGVVKKDLPAINKEFSQFIGDKVICSVYALPGTKELSKNVVAGLGDKRNAVILPNHGTFCVGKDIKTTFTVSHILEQSAHAYILALANGSPNILSEDDIIAIQKAKAS